MRLAGTTAAKAAFYVDTDANERKAWGATGLETL